MGVAGLRRWWLRVARWRSQDDDGASPEVRRARELVAAVDRGGLPLNPLIVNQVARALGLEVSSRAPIDHTVERIRQALTRT